MFVAVVSVVLPVKLAFVAVIGVLLAVGDRLVYLSKFEIYTNMVHYLCDIVR